MKLNRNSHLLVLIVIDRSDHTDSNNYPAEHIVCGLPPLIAVSHLRTYSCIMTQGKLVIQFIQYIIHYIHTVLSTKIHKTSFFAKYLTC